MRVSAASCMFRVGSAVFGRLLGWASVVSAVCVDSPKTLCIILPDFTKRGNSCCLAIPDAHETDPHASVFRRDVARPTLVPLTIDAAERHHLVRFWSSRMPRLFAAFSV